MEVVSPSLLCLQGWEKRMLPNDSGELLLIMLRCWLLAHEGGQVRHSTITLAVSRHRWRVVEPVYLKLRSLPTSHRGRAEA